MLHRVLDFLFDRNRGDFSVQLNEAIGQKIHSELASRKFDCELTARTQKLATLDCIDQRLERADNLGSISY